MDPNVDDNVETGATENTAAEVETVETEQDASQTETQEPGTQEQKDDEQKQEEKPKRNRAQERIEQLARENAELKRWQAEQQAKASQPQQASQAPNIEDFESFADYQQAQQEFFIKQAEDRVLAKLQQEKSQQSQIEVQAQFESAVVELESEGIDINAYHEKAKSLPPLPVTLDQFGLSAKDTLTLAKDLIDQPDLYLDLSQMNPIQFATKMGQMIAERQSKPSVPKTSKAPPPINPVKANAPAARDSSQMSDDEWYRNEQAKRKGK